jgi:hypothetical protein
MIYSGFGRASDDESDYHETGPASPPVLAYPPPPVLTFPPPVLNLPPPVLNPPPASSPLLESIMAAQVQIKEMNGEETSRNELFTSRIVAVTLGSSGREPPKTFHLHSSLLCRESKRFEKGLTTKGFVDERDMKIDLEYDDCPYFGYFVDYLYTPKWEPKQLEPLLLVLMYAMGERLVAKGFQDTIHRVFNEQVSSARYSGDGAVDQKMICHLLRVACQQITEREPEDDPMREDIFRLAASKLTWLQGAPEFRELLCHFPELGMQLALRAGNGPMFSSKNRNKKTVAPEASPGTGPGANLRARQFVPLSRMRRNSNPAGTQ